MKKVLIVLAAAGAVGIWFLYKNGEELHRNMQICGGKREA